MEILTSSQRSIGTGSPEPEPADSTSRYSDANSVAPSNTSSMSSNPPDIRQTEQERRASIQAIMKDRSLNETERRRSIQNLMDGRRRSSLVNFRRCSSMQEDLSDVDDNETKEDLSISGSLPPSPPRAAVPTTRDMRQVLKRSYSEPIPEYGDTAGSTHSLNLAEMNLHERRSSILPNTAFNLQGDRVGDPERLVKCSPECNHYQRKCSIISPCCGMIFGCRLCHDECDQLSPPIFDKEDLLDEEEDMLHIPRKIKLESGAKAKVTRRGSMSSIMSSISEMGDDVHHNIDRFAVKEIICRECFTRQSSKSNECITCKAVFGEYHCEICNLWMNSEERPYHCDKCGFCRVGGEDRFRHCDGCGMCIDVSLFDEHNCKSGKYMANCPVCYEDLFSSRMLTHEMPCGHNIHWHCFNSLTSHDIRCPICKKTATHEDMTEVWSALADDIAMQPLPPDQARCVDIVCNDCGEHEEDRRWHYLGVECNSCGSFNTSHNTKLTGEEAHEYLNRIEASQERR